MVDPIAFASSTPALALPLLIAGQAQKEFFVNEALWMLDALHARSVIASLSAPPTAAVEGACYRVTAPASGSWTGEEDRIAVRIAGGWRFVTPADGWLVFDRAAGRLVIFRSEWHPATIIAAPTGGAVVDNEARAALNALIAALGTMGVLGTSAT